MAQLVLRPRQSHKGLTCWPLVGPNHARETDPAPIALSAALEDGFVSVRFSSALSDVGADAAAGWVESLDDRCRVTIENRAALPVVALCGEDLPGARSGLCANASAIVPPKSSVSFEASPLPSPSARSQQLARSFGAVPGQVGFIAAIADEIAGIECVSSPQLYAHAAPTLLRGYAVEAIAREQLPCERVVRFDAPEPFLDALSNATLKPAGVDAPLRVAAPGVIGRALWDGTELIHLAAFPIAV